MNTNTETKTKTFSPSPTHLAKTALDKVKKKFPNTYKKLGE